MCACGDQHGLSFETSRSVETEDEDGSSGDVMAGVPLRSAPRHSAQCLPVSGHAVREQGGGHVLVPLGARKLVSFPKWEILELIRVVWLVFGILAEKAICHSWFLNLVGTWKGKAGLAVDDQCS